MSNEITNKRVPILRFPEFIATEAWFYLNGDEAFEQISDKNHNSDLPILAITQEHGAIPRDKIDYNVSVTDKSIESYKVVNVGDFIISLRSFQGGIEYSSYKGICSPAYIILRKKNDAVNGFFKYYFKTPAFIRDLTKNIEGIRDGKMVSYKQFSELFLPFPKPNEQQKIADCLSSLDELITTQTQKLEAFKTHKKGLMQQLFPADGETVPKRRFAEFKKGGEWEEDILEGKGIALFVNEKMSLDKLELEYYVSTENLLPDYGGKTISSNLPSSGSITRFKRKDVLLSNIRPYLKKVWFANIDGGASNDVIIIRADSELEASFLSFLLKNDDFINYIMKGAEGVKMPRGDKDLIKEYPIKFPEKAEQQKIAECLSSLDELITAQTEKIEEIRRHKKGLMQGLFPNVIE